MPCARTYGVSVDGASLLHHKGVVSHIYPSVCHDKSQPQGFDISYARYCPGDHHANKSEPELGECSTFDGFAKDKSHLFEVSCLLLQQHED